MSNDFVEKTVLPLQKELFTRIKEYELAVDGYVPDETLNELRYAFRAIMAVEEILCQPEESQDKGALHQAEQRTVHALLCAYHDLVDGLYEDIVSIMQMFNVDYKAIFIEEIGEEKRLEMYAFTDEVKEQIANSRSDSNGRREVYSEVIYKAYFKKLLEYRKYLFETLLPILYVKDESAEKEKQELENNNIELKEIVETLKIDRDKASEDRKLAKEDRDIARKHQRTSMIVAFFAIILSILLTIYSMRGG